MSMFTATRGLVAGAGLLAAATVPCGAPADGAPKVASAWTTVVNHGDLVPGSVKTFNSYNPPSVNAAGEVVFRARSRGPDRVAGIYRGGRDGVVGTVADITSTGETLRANHLKILSDGLIHRSQATLFRARKAAWDRETRGAFEALAGRLGEAD